MFKLHLERLNILSRIFAAGIKKDNLHEDPLVPDCKPQKEGEFFVITRPAIPGTGSVFGIHPCIFIPDHK